MYGRYEFIGTTDKGNPSEKFWELRDVGNGMAVATWGKIGTVGRETEYGEGEAYKKASEKLSKGYELVSTEADVVTESHKQRKERKRKKKITQVTPFMEAMDDWEEAK